MRKSVSQFSSICRLLTLLLILLACFLDASPVSATYSPKLNIEDSNYQLSGAPSLTRRYKLWNRCSEKFVRIKFTGRRGIDAKGKKTKKFTTILITSIGPDRVLIQGEESHQFLCFNKRGRIRARHKPRKENCNFIQNLTPSGFVNFRLEGNELWYVGFRKKSGKPLPGFRKIPGSKMESCYDFDLIPLDEQRPRFDFRNLNIPVKEQHKKRHYKKRKPRRRKIENLNGMELIGENRGFNLGFKTMYPIRIHHDMAYGINCVNRYADNSFRCLPGLASLA